MRWLHELGQLLLGLIKDRSGGGKGGGGGSPAPPTEQTINQTNLPDYAEPFFTRLLERTEAESNRDYTPFPDQRLSEFGPDTLQGFQGIRDIAGSGRASTFGTAEGALTNAALYNPENLGFFGPNASFADPGVAQAFMNPFIDQVLDRTQRRATERFDEQQLGRDAEAVRSGAFGGTRAAITGEVARRDLNERLDDINAQSLAQAYESGAGIFGRELGFDLQNRALNADVFSQNRAGQLQAEQQRIAAAQGLFGLGLGEEQVAQDRARGLVGVGGAFEDRSQQGLDIGYSDFINQRDFPRQQLNYYSGILRGVPIAAQQETTTYQAPPNQLSQLLGFGLGGLGLANQFDVFG